MTVLMVWAMLAQQWRQSRFVYTVTWVIMSNRMYCDVKHLQHQGSCTFTTTLTSLGSWHHNGYDITMATTSWQSDCRLLQCQDSEDFTMAVTWRGLQHHNVSHVRPAMDSGSYDFTTVMMTSCHLWGHKVIGMFRLHYNLMGPPNVCSAVHWSKC